MDKLISIIKSKIECGDFYSAEFMINKKLEGLMPIDALNLVTECLKLAIGNSIELFTFLTGLLHQCISNMHPDQLIANTDRIKEKIIEVLKNQELSKDEIREINKIDFRSILSAMEIQDLGIIKSNLRKEVEAIFNGSTKLNDEQIRAMVYKNYFALIKEVLFEDSMCMFIKSLKDDQIFKCSDKTLKNKFVDYFEVFLKKLKETCKNKKEMKKYFLDSVKNIRLKYGPYENVVAFVGTLY